MGWNWRSQVQTWGKTIGLGMLIWAVVLGQAGAARAWLPQDEVAGQAALERWQTAFAEIQDMIPKIRAATASNRNELLQQYQTSLTELKQLRREVEPALLQAVQDSTSIPQPLHDALLELGRLAVSEDSYERAFQLLKPLVDAGSEEGLVYQFAAVAAFGSDRFEVSQQLVEKIKASGDELRIEFMRRSATGLASRIEQWKAEEAIRAAEAEKDDLPRVKFETTAGDVIIELYEDQAPNTVANFITLVEKGYYDGLTFHRVLPQFMAQGGCPNGTGGGGPGYSVPCECHQANYRKHFSGTLSMAHAGRDTGGSQFFLTFLATPHLDGQHTAFGRVIEGMDAVASLEKMNPEAPNPTMQASKIVKATVVRKRDHEYKARTLPSSR
jgi:cyclophilin family peptidyl-prolyl cis-trans isomerase